MDLKFLRAPLTLSLVPGLAALLVGWQVSAEGNRAEFPKNLEALVHYTTVHRGEVTEHMLTSREALNAIRDGQPVPTGTQVILADYRDGKIHRYFVMQKGEGWGNDYDQARRTEDWQFQWYWPDGSFNTAENTARCQSCHQSRSDSQFMFTFSDAQDFEG